MSRITQILFLVLLCVACLAALVMLSPETFFSTRTFINEADMAQTLELRVNSRPNSVIPRVAEAFSGGRLLGKQVGLFELKTEQGTSTGYFVWMKGPAFGKPDSTQTLILRPTAGKEWSVKLTDGSFQDGQGITWRLKTNNQN